MIALAVIGGPVTLLLASAPADGVAVLVIGGDAARIVSVAGGTPVGPLGAPFGTLATSAAPDFARRLKRNGAWFVLDGRALAAICGVSA